jgi:hypothetical protein
VNFVGRFDTEFVFFAMRIKPAGIDSIVDTALYIGSQGVTDNQHFGFVGYFQLLEYIIKNSFVRLLASGCF